MGTATKMLKFIGLVALAASSAMANTQQFHHNPNSHLQPQPQVDLKAARSGGFGANANLGLGVLSLLNILTDVAGALLNKNEKPASSNADDKSPAKPDARRYQRNIAFLADNVLNAIEAFSDKHQ